MKCLILAAGYATRLYPLTENFPKPLLKIQDKTIIDWLIEDIVEEIDEFIIVTNHKFYNFFNSWAKEKDFKVTVVDDGTTENEQRLGAVKDIELGLKDNEDDVLVMAGDNVLDFSLNKFISFFKEKNASCIMTHFEDRLEKQRKTAIITFDENKKITSYEEKPLNPKGNHAVPPFYIYKAKDLSRINEALLDGCGKDAPGSFGAWLSSKVDMYAYEMPGQRHDIGDINSYKEVEENYKGRIK